MTEPVAGAASPRRTVRVAAALVAGQATLCAVIGWVTFGSPQTGSTAPPAGRVAPLAVPPIVVPTASMGLPPTAVPSTSAAAARPKPSGRAPRPPVPVSTPKPRATTEAPPPATMVSPPPPPSTTATSSPAVPPPDLAATAPPSPPPTVQGPVVEGEPCDPVGALGRTADEVKVHCVRGDDDRPRWEII